MHAFVNELERRVGTHLYGRRMYETMVYWETAHAVPDQQRFVLDFAEIWQSAEKVVYSKTLTTISSARTRIEREFDPYAVRRIKEAETRDITVGGTHLAAAALSAGLVDELQVFVTPIVVGGGNRFLPDGFGQRLDLVNERRFRGGVVYLNYRARADRDRI